MVPIAPSNVQKKNIIESACKLHIKSYLRRFPMWKIQNCLDQLLFVVRSGNMEAWKEIKYYAFTWFGPPFFRRTTQFQCSLPSFLIKQQSVFDITLCPHSLALAGPNALIFQAFESIYRFFRSVVRYSCFIDPPWADTVSKSRYFWQLKRSIANIFLEILILKILPMVIKSIVFWGSLGTFDETISAILENLVFVFGCFFAWHTWTIVCNQHSEMESA